VFNPLDKGSLGESVARAVLERDPIRMPIPDCRGAGVYVIYYTGDFEPYKRIADANKDGKWGEPIYVGKAVPEGARKGIQKLNSAEGKPLFKRLREHHQSVSKGGLNGDDFWVRFLVLDDVWIPLGESLLIQRFKPLWNVLLDGFGNHAPGGGRGKGKLSAWDTVHGGRYDGYQPNVISKDGWIQGINDFLAGREVSSALIENANPDAEADQDAEE
jgi:hypothetical protein